MSRLRRFVLKLMPRDMAARAEAESRKWMMRCTECGTERSVWDAGGLRYKAKGNPRRRLSCTTCNKPTWHEVYLPPE